MEELKDEDFKTIDVTEVSASGGNTVEEATAFDFELKKIGDTIDVQKLAGLEETSDEINAKIVKLQYEFDNVPKPWTGENKTKRANLKKEISSLKTKLDTAVGKIEFNMTNMTEEVECYNNLAVNIGYKIGNLKNMNKVDFIEEKISILQAASKYYKNNAKTVASFILDLSKATDGSRLLNGYSALLGTKKDEIEDNVKKIFIKEGMKPGSTQLAWINNPYIMLALSMGLPALAIISINKTGGRLNMSVEEPKKKDSQQSSENSPSKLPLDTTTKK